MGFIGEAGKLWQVWQANGVKGGGGGAQPDSAAAAIFSSHFVPELKVPSIRPLGLHGLFYGSETNLTLLMLLMSVKTTPPTTHPINFNDE